MVMVVVLALTMVGSSGEGTEERRDGVWEKRTVVVLGLEIWVLWVWVSSPGWVLWILGLGFRFGS